MTEPVDDRTEASRHIIDAVGGDKRVVASVLSIPVPAVAEHRESPASLVGRAQAGDRGALEKLTRSHINQVERMLHRLLGPRRDMDDLVQNVFLEMSRALSAFRGDSAFSTFLGGITVRVARRAMRPTAWQRRSTPLVDEPVVERSDPDRTAHATERLRRVERLLDGLPEAQRTAFVLWALEGLEPATIATMTDATLAATRSRIFYAQKRLEEGAKRDPWLAEWLNGGDDEP